MAETVVINFTGKDDLSPTAKNVERSIRDVGETAEAQGSKFDGMKEIARGAFQSIGSFAVNAASQIGSSIVGGVTDFFTSAVRGSMDYQNVLAQTEAVIESTGMAAGFSVQQMEAMARSMSAAEGMSLFPDDAILSAQNVLATFTKIEGVQFEGATQAALDMAQALGMDLSGAAMMMGKALNDPVKGMSALSRSGVSFTDAQKALVEEMVAVGDVAGAQQLILKEMEVQFGGSALKATETFEGSMILLSEAFEDAKGSIGDALLPVLTGFVNVARNFVMPIVQELLAGFGAWINGIDWIAITQSISGLINGFISLGEGVNWGGIFASLNQVASVIGQALMEAFTVIQPMLIVVKDVFMQLFSVITSPAVIQILTAIGGALMSIASIAGTVISALTPLASLISTTFMGAVQALLNGLAPAFTTIQNLIGQLTPYIQSAITAIGDVFASPALKSAMDGLVGAFGVVGEIVSVVVGILSGLVTFIVSNLAPVIAAIWPVVQITFNTIFSVIDNVVKLVRGVLDSLLLLLKGDFTGAWNTLKNAIATAWTGISTAVQTGINGVKAKLQEWINGAAQFGKDLVAGIAKGITASAGSIANAAKSAAQSALDSAKKLLGIASPSKVMAMQVGLPIGQGLAAGIMESIPAIRGAMAVSLGAAQGQATQSVQNYYLSATYQTTQSESSIRNDLRAMQILSGAV